MMGGPGSGRKAGENRLPKGQSPNPGGRKPGSPNKTSVAIREAIEELTNGDPLPVLLTRIGLRELEKGEDGSLQMAHRCLVDACKYAYPQLQAIAHSGKVDGMPSITVLMD